MVQRADRSVVDVFPGMPVENPLALNVVDLCPVGALNDKDFLYEARVWFTRETESVCPSCSRGCNLKVTVLDNDIKRLVPRPNPAVNRWWMCDEGRRNFRYINSPRRLTSGRGAVRDIVTEARKARIAAVVSAGQTIEEMFLFKKLAEALQADPVGILTRTEGELRTFKDGFAIEPDRTPNRAYAGKLFGRETVDRGVKEVVEALRSGSAKGLFVLNGLPDFEMPAALVEAARKAEFAAVADLLRNPLEEFARVVIPATAWAEKEGTFLNADGRVQRVRKAVEPPASARPEVAWLQEALVEAGARRDVLSAEGVFREAMPGLDYSKVGRGGVTIDSRSA
jgi:NADH-quinone oxidoreductase subunit G